MKSCIKDITDFIIFITKESIKLSIGFVIIATVFISTLSGIYFVVKKLFNLIQ